MKYIILVPDGVADEPMEELDGKTPLEAARTTNMDFLAKNGSVGMVQTIPAHLPCGSDVGNMALLGYDPKKFYTGRAPLEAANLGIDLKNDEIAFRCNLVTIEDHKMEDYSAGHISTKEAAQIIETLNQKMNVEEARFVTGKSYRHLMILKVRNVDDLMEVTCTPPHDIIGKDITKFLPQGIHAQLLLKIMERSKTILKGHPVNNVRVDLKENPADMIWLWGQGVKPHLPSFKEKFNLTGAMISAVDLVNGIGRLAGLEVISVPGITGYYDTNYLGKAEYALNALKEKDFVYIHVEGTDEAGHNGDYKAKIKCIEHIDREILGTILNHFGKNADVRILVLPDHPTPVKKRTHTRNPVPYVMYGKRIPVGGAETYSETSGEKTGLKFASAEKLIEEFILKYV